MRPPREPQYILPEAGCSLPAHRRGTGLLVLAPAAFQLFLHLLKLLGRNDLKMRERLRIALSTAQHARIQDILEDVLNRGIVEVLSIAVVNAFFRQERRDFSAPVTVMRSQVKDAPNHFRLLLIN